jgi:hypothetical protein
MIPNEPDFDKEIANLTALYDKSIEDVRRVLDSIDLSRFTPRKQTAILRQVHDILAQLNDESSGWITAHMADAAIAGAVVSVLALGGAKTVAGAEKAIKSRTVTDELVKAAMSDTQNDLLAVTQNVERKVRAAVRQAYGGVLRSNLSRGVNGRKTMNADVIDKLRKQLGDSLNSGIIDAAHRRWKPSVYVDMATRTKMMRLSLEATATEALSRDAQYGVISSHGAKDGCGRWEGRVVKLTADAPGDYPLLDDLYGGGYTIFHPNCRHVVSPVMDPNKY